MIQEDLDKLEVENIDNISLVAKTYMDEFAVENIDNISLVAKTYMDEFAVDEQPSGDIVALRTLLVTLEEVEKEIAA